MIRDDVMEMRRAFWDKFYGRTTQAELEAKVKEIMGRQASLPL